MFVIVARMAGKIMAWTFSTFVLTTELTTQFDIMIVSQQQQ